MHVVRRVAACCVTACALVACMHDFDAFAPNGDTSVAAGDGGENDGDGAVVGRDGASTDAAVTDARVVDGGPCTAPSSCTTTSRSCATACRATQGTCLSNCFNTPCRNRCNADENTCASGCISACVSCTGNVSCTSTCAVAADGG